MQTVTIAIPVTAKHIADGQHRQCPVALAIQDRTNLFANVDLWDVRLWYERVGSSFKIDLPHSARLWIYKFDRGDRVGPLTFPLTLPVEVG